MKVKKYTKVVSVLLTDQMYEKLNDYTETKKVSVSDAIREIVGKIVNNNGGTSI